MIAPQIAIARRLRGGKQLGRQWHAVRLLDVGQAAAQQVGDLGRRAIPAGRFLGVQPVDDLDQPGGTRD